VAAVFVVRNAQMHTISRFLPPPFSIAVVLTLAVLGQGLPYGYTVPPQPKLSKAQVPPFGTAICVCVGCE
jgi:hypothetical protein